MSWFFPVWGAIRIPPPRWFIVIFHINQLYHSLILNVRVWCFSWNHLCSLLSIGINWFLFELLKPVSYVKYSTCLGTHKHSYTVPIGWDKRITAIKDENIRFLNTFNIYYMSSATYKWSCCLHTSSCTGNPQQLNLASACQIVGIQQMFIEIRA